MFVYTLTHIIIDVYLNSNDFFSLYSVDSCSRGMTNGLLTFNRNSVASICIIFEDVLKRLFIIIIIIKLIVWIGCLNGYLADTTFVGKYQTGISTISQFNHYMNLLSISLGFGIFFIEFFITKINFNSIVFFTSIHADLNLSESANNNVFSF